MNRLLRRRLTVSVFWSFVYLSLLSYVVYLNFASADVDTTISNKLIKSLNESKNETTVITANILTKDR